MPPAAAVPHSPGRLLYLSQGCRGWRADRSQRADRAYAGQAILPDQRRNRQAAPAAVTRLAGLARQSGPVLAALASRGRLLRCAGLGGQGPQGTTWIVTFGRRATPRRWARAPGLGRLPYRSRLCTVVMERMLRNNFRNGLPVVPGSS